MADNFTSHQSGLESPASSAAEVTPHDSTDLAFVTRGIYVGTSGDISAELVSGDVVVFVGVPAGTVLPIRVARVNSTNTSADDLVALW